MPMIHAMKKKSDAKIRSKMQESRRGSLWAAREMQKDEDEDEIAWVVARTLIQREMKAQKETFCLPQLLLPSRLAQSQGFDSLLRDVHTSGFVSLHNRHDFHLCG